MRFGTQAKDFRSALRSIPDVKASIKSEEKRASWHQLKLLKIVIQLHFSFLYFSFCPYFASGSASQIATPTDYPAPRQHAEAKSEDSLCLYKFAYSNYKIHQHTTSKLIVNAL